MTKPIDDTIDKHTLDARLKAQGYSLIPEFNISEHIDYYVESNGGNFLADNNSLFTIKGGQIANSSDAEFAKVYSNSDFLKDFARIRKEHKDEAKPTRIDLKASAIMKFVPYEGFYPVERCVKLSELFSQSYGPGMSLTGTQPSTRPIDMAMFSPGILFNSIKSGLGVSWLATTSSVSYLYTNERGDICADGSPSIYTVGGFHIPFEAIIEPSSYILGANLHDIIAHPSGVLDATSSIGYGTPKYSMAMHNFIASTVDFFIKDSKMSALVSKADDDKKYFNMSLAKEYRMRVILRGCKNFDELTLFERAAIDGDVEGTVLGINSNEANLLARSTLGFAGTASYNYSVPTFNMYDRPNFNNNDLPDHTASNAFASPNSYRHGGSAFGPGTFNLGNNIVTNGSTTTKVYLYGDIQYTVYTPPYYDGFAWVDFVFKPFDEDGTIYKDTSRKQEYRKFTLNEILNNLSASYYRWSPMASLDYCFSRGRFDFAQITPITDFTGSNTLMNTTLYLSQMIGSEMQVDQCLRLFDTIINKKVIYDQDGSVKEILEDTTAGNRWVIQTKWETPIFDYTDSCESDVPTSGSQNIGRGVWHSYGNDLGSEEGLFLQVMDVPKRYLKFSSSPLTNPVTIEELKEYITGSLADVVGFKKEPVKIGKISDKQSISEAIVAIPFIEKDRDRIFFKINEDLLNLAKTGDSFVVNGKEISAGSSISKMISSMKKYVIPPKFNFLTYDGREGRPKVDPIVMYFFDFEYEMDREDIKKIWHNIKPSAKMVESEITIGHELLENELLDSFDDNLRWLVFKVKQKAEWNYYKKTLDSSDDQKFQFQFNINEQSKVPDYSYNWPYDFMSVIEYGKFDVSVTLETEEEALRRRSNFISTKKFEKNIIEQIDIRERIKNTGFGVNTLNKGVVPINNNTSKKIKGGDVQKVVESINKQLQLPDKKQDKEVELKAQREQTDSGVQVRKLELSDSFKKK